MPKRLAGLTLMLLVCGCAQNQEQPTTVEQRTEQHQATEGPDTPQTTTITVNVNGGHRSESGDIRSASSQPAAPGAGDLDGKLLAANDSGVSGGGQTAGSNIVIAPIWIDSRGLQKTQAGETSPHTGSMSPKTGAVTPSNEGTQRPEADLNIPLSIAAGMNPAASSQGTQAARSGQVSASPQSSDQSGPRSVTQLRAASSGLQQLLDFLRVRVLSPELAAATTAMEAQKQAIDQALADLIAGAPQPQPPASQPSSQPAAAVSPATPAFDFGNQ